MRRMAVENDTALNYRLLKLIEERPAISQRELARELGLSLGKVNYCLKAFVKKGLIKADNFRRSDNKRAYAYLLTPKGIEEKARLTLAFFRHVSAEYEALKREMETLDAASRVAGRADASVLREICRRIVAAIGPERIYLFGSRAWGTPEPDSDVDVFVIVAHSAQPAYRRAREVYRCLRGIGVPVDVVVQTRDEVARAAGVRASLARKVLDEGVLLYG